MLFESDARGELKRRYNMDADIWVKSQRTSFPFSLSLNTVVGLAVLLPVAILVFPFGDSPIKSETVWILVITLAISIFAFYLAQHLIVLFKDTLAAKGLFGKDLNKAGERDTKEKV